MSKMDGKVALVTGSSMGIGEGIATALAARGFHLAITHLQEEDKGISVQENIRRHGVECELFQCDLRDEQAPEKLVNDAVERFGRLDVLVNNAGVVVMGKITEFDPQRLNDMIHVNFRAPLLASRAAAKHMMERGAGGSIIHTTSSRAERAYPVDAVYGGLKAGLTRAAQSMAIEFAPYGIRVNCVAPGMIIVREQAREFYEAFQDRIPIGRYGTPADIGKAVAWLASDDSGYVTGTTVRVDGGLILPGMPENLDLVPPGGWGQIRKK